MVPSDPVPGKGTFGPHAGDPRPVPSVDAHGSMRRTNSGDGGWLFPDRRGPRDEAAPFSEQALQTGWRENVAVGADPPVTEAEEHFKPTGTIFVLALFVATIILLWGSVYVILLARGVTVQ